MNRSEQLVSEGYHIIADNEEFTTFKKPKKLNGWLLLVLLLLGFWPGLIYLIFYAAKKDDLVTLQK